MPANLAAGWDIVVQYASNPWSLPEVHSFLQERLGAQYIPSEWTEPLDTVLRAENDVEAALAALAVLRKKWAAGPDSPSDLCESAIPDECSKIEADLLALVDQLKARRQITGQPLTLEELVDLEEEWEIGQSLDAVELDDLEIVQMVQMGADLVRGEIEEIETDSSGDGDPEEVLPSLREMIDTCRMFEEKSHLVCEEGAFEFVQAARQYWANLQKMHKEQEKQTTLDMFFNVQLI